MHDKDIELLKLLNENCITAEARLAELQTEYDSLKQELDSIEETADSRAGFSELLEEAASLLDRKDLVVEIPDASELKSKAEELSGQLASAVEDAGKYRSLLDQLTARAPDLLKAAGLAGNPAVPAAEESLGQSEVPPEPDPPDEKDLLQEMDRFNLKIIRKREKSGHGRGAVYIIDGSSVLTRVPAYDYNRREVDEKQVYDELFSDLNELGGQISGSFCVMSAKPYQPVRDFGPELSAVSPHSDDGESEDRVSYLLRLADEFTGRLRNVCVVTGEADLIKQVKDRGMHSMNLSEFFRA